MVLLTLGGYAIAVSFAHTMQFIRDHGQNAGWIVVGTACTVVGLTIQSALEVYRDSRDDRPLGAPVALLCVGVAVELTANASTAPGGITNRIVAAWPVLVAAAALHTWTRRLAHYAAAETGPAPVDPSRRRDDVNSVPDTVPDDWAPFRNTAAAVPAASAPAAALADVDATAPPEIDPVRATVDALPVGTYMDRGAALLAVHPHLTAEEIASYLGCSDRYGRSIRQAANDGTGPRVPDHIHPAQDLIEIPAAA